ncbi:GNAT family N-acetyltransferase [Streptomyces sp. SCSIO ZS0520]|uniref:GNAT family N-acetyltransferase n=1 Tax=Streptomyces sp. SCSIO ZS0520 TaxID=2892996 RepID=UPI0021DB4EB5|nr:GNAT family N-acetyltransferase [Streptomyces sp. SCSIO ZS0520]
MSAPGTPRTPRTSPALRSARLRLDPYAPADEESFLGLFQQAEVARWMGDGLAPEAEDRALFGRIFSRVYAGGLFDVWAVRLRDAAAPGGHRYIGHAEVKPSGAVPGGHEIIYALDPAAWGRGLGSELAAALVAYGFGELGLAEVHATVAAPNSGSLAVLDRLGFRHVRDLAEEDGSTTRLLALGRERAARGGPAPGC